MISSPWIRRLHRWATPFVMLTFGVVLATGTLLLLKKQLSWVQPPTQKGASPIPQVGFDVLLAAARAEPRMQVETWSDINRVDFRPKDGVIKVDALSRWEMQFDATTGEVLQIAYRRSDLIETLHDGSWFHDWAKLGLFLPSALVLIMMWFTGVILFVQPWMRRSRGRTAAAVRGKSPSAAP